MRTGYPAITAIIGAIFLSMAAASQAQVVTIGGTGTVAGTSGTPGVTSTLPNGAPISFIFSFDPATAVASMGPPTVRSYRITAAGFRATLGDHVFTFGGGQPSFATVTFSQGFMSFGGPVSEAVVTQTFSFFGTADGSPPFTVGDSPAENFVFASQFRRGVTIPDLTIGALSDPATAFNAQFSYSASGLLGTGRAGGSAAAAFVSSVAPVPEPDTWAMMILGFGLIGAALRRRTGAVLAGA